MASKKRSHDDDSEPPTNKRRIISSSNGSPLPNGVNEDEPSEEDNLELFRKEAIYRKMKHYSRELSRSQSRVEQLELKRQTCEAGLAAISACWSQLIDAIKALAKPEELLPPHERVQEAFNITAHIHGPPDSLRALLDKRKNATQALISRFLQVGDGHRTLLDDPAYLDFQTTRTECAALRSQVDNLHHQLQESEELRTKYQEELSAAENRYERLKSKSVRATDGRQSDALAIKSEALKPEEDSKGDSLRNPSPPAHTTGQLNGLSDGFNEWKDTAERRTVQLEKAYEEMKKMNVAFGDLKERIQNPPLSVIQGHPNYQFMLEKISHLNHNIQEYEAKILQVQETAHQAVQARIALETGLPAEHAQQIQELKLGISRRDIDISRLREIRDQQQAELNERRQKDMKLTSLEEFKKLAHTRGEYISVLQDRLRLCKAELAGAAGAEDLMKFFFTKETDVSYVEDLKQRLTIAQEELDSYRRATSLYNDEKQSAFEEHRKTVQRLTSIEAELAKYQSIYGSSSLSAESSALVEQLQRKEEDIKRLRLEASQRAEAESSLYAELDKISSAWEGLEHQLKTKIYDLAALEDRASKSAIERAKSENKYYQAMREKDAIESERKNLQRVYEKQQKVLEQSVEAETKLRSMLTAVEGEVDSYKKALEEIQKTLQETDNNYLAKESLLSIEIERRQKLNATTTELRRELETLKMDTRKAKEAEKEAQIQAERLAAKLKAATGTNKSAKPSDLQVQLDETLAVLKCSTCKQSMRSIVLSKCLHTFCKECIDARISTRQRKCPSCNLPFSQGEVLQMYFQ